MQRDFLSYRKALNVSILGLVVQLVVALAFLIYGNRFVAGPSGDGLAMMAAYFGFIGVAGWLVLVILFDQHRRERIESMESDAFRESGAATSSVFEGGEEFRVAQRRLNGLYKFLLPAASLVMAFALIGIGVWQFWELTRTGESILTRKLPAKAPMAEWAIALGLAVGVVGFILARFTAGMSRQPVWQNLRGGASFAVGSSLMGLTLAAAHFVDVIGPDSVLRWALVVMPIVLVVLGVEMVLNLLLEVYRPRRPGEYPRPGFDSRLLSLIAAPDIVVRSIGDALSYQFGYDITGNWLYRLVARYVVPLVGVGVAVIWVLTCVVVVQPHQRGIVLRFGNYQREVGPGAHLKLPWPIDSVEIPVYETRDEKGRLTATARTATGIRTVQLATVPKEDARAVLWTNEHAGEEVYFVVQPTRTAQQAAPGAGQSANRDIALVAVEIPLKYVVTDVKAYDLLAQEESARVDLIMSVARREVTKYIGQFSMDDALGDKRTSMQEELRVRIGAALSALNPDDSGKPRGAGVEVVSVLINGAHPPRAVAPRFENVLSAQQKAEANVQTARGEAVKTLTGVVGSAPLARQISAEITKLNTLRENKATPAQVAEQETAIQRMIEQAGGEAATLIASARADRWKKHMDARGRALRYEGHLAMYRAAPDIYLTSLYFEAMSAAMKRSRVYIVPDGVRTVWDLQDKDSSIGVFTAPKKD